MTTNRSAMEETTRWHWGVLLFVCAVFLGFVVLAVLKREWVAVAIAVIGLVIFGRALFIKLLAKRADESGRQ